MDRRGFLRTGLALGATALLPSSAFSQEKEQFDANAFVENFPTAKEIPGIARVRRYRVDGANRVLAVLRQHHEVVDPLPEHVEEIEDCQTELLQAMDYLWRQPALRFRAVHNESTHFGDEEGYLNHYRSLTRRRLEWALEDRNGESVDGLSDAEFEELLHDEPALQYRIGEFSTLARVGAAEILSLRGHLQIRAGECSKLRLRIREAEDSPDREDMLFDEREDMVVQYAAETGDDVNYVVYGAAHNFRNNLRKWNRQQRDGARFASVVLTPHTAHRCDRERRKRKNQPVPLPPPPPPLPPQQDFIDFF